LHYPFISLKNKVFQTSIGIIYDFFQTVQSFKKYFKKAAWPLCGAWGNAPLSDGNCESNFLAKKAPKRGFF